MADTPHPGATPDHVFPPLTRLDELLDELHADLTDASEALQGLVALLRGCDAEQPIPAGHLRLLLQPIAMGVKEASFTLAVIQR